ncbi:MAG: UDP-N-acetylmuramate dehydrogenase [Candidatus Omnitrophica bacterium]|nr:UDP-N-acetylmuramate dehydrogenase [Candidatus Omnitrophota bacterium]
MNWLSRLNIKCKQQEPLALHTTFRIGGPARFFFEPNDRKELAVLLCQLKKRRLSFLVLGGGSNILVSDGGVRRPIIRLSSPSFKTLVSRKQDIIAGSGVSLAKLLAFAVQQGLSGLEFLTGIPGTLGGAIAMNAGIPGQSIGDLVESVTVMHYNGCIERLTRGQIAFGYRRSGLVSSIILEARLRLTGNSASAIRTKMRDVARKRHLLQDPRWICAGSIFKNPAGAAAGKLIDACGLKGKRVGGACIASGHANFIINVNKAGADDVLELMSLAKKAVRDKFNITLRPEIKIWGKG